MSSFVARLSSTAALVLTAGLLAGAGPPQESSSSGSQAPMPSGRVALPEGPAPDENVRPEPANPRRRRASRRGGGHPSGPLLVPLRLRNRLEATPGRHDPGFRHGHGLRVRNGRFGPAHEHRTAPPGGSTLKYLRLYYNDTDATLNSRGWITRYNGSAYEDLVYVASTGSPGASFIVSTELTHPVDNTAWGYTLIGGPTGLGSTAQVCGLRVAYYAPSQGQFTPITPCRLVDTRAPVFPAPLGGGWLPAATVRSYTLTGVCGLPAGVTAVSLNATVTGPAGPGFLALYPEGGTFPPVSTLNFLGGDTIVNAAVVPLSATGGISMALGVSGGHVILDVNGYYY